MSHNHQKKLAVISDLSGFGRCALSVGLPLISHLGIQCCPLPTAVFSNHTGFDSFYFTDCTDHMEPYMDEWKKLDLKFNGILTGFLGSERQIGLVERFLNLFTTEETTVVIDPVMGDNGRPYSTYTPELCRQMKRLVRHADILTPNLTEACILTNTPYEGADSEECVRTMAEALAGMGPDRIVITGISAGDLLLNYCYQRDQGLTIQAVRRIEPRRSGTGDVFASIVAAGAVHHIPFDTSVQTASDFICRCLERSSELDIPTTDGVCFEEVLDQLHF